VEVFINFTGRALKVCKRDISAAVSKLGYIHVRSIDRPSDSEAGHGRTVIITLEPRLNSDLMVAAVAYEIADLNPSRTIVVVGVSCQKSWVFPGYLPAIRKIAALVAGRAETDRSGESEVPIRRV
jgi:hypothetical protein